MRTRALAVAFLTAVIATVLTLAAPATAAKPAAVENPPTGISPNVFATQYKGCLGPLRSSIAQGEFAGVGPFGAHFTGQVNPGRHVGTVGEEEFLRLVIGIPADQLAGFCAGFK